MNTPKRKMVTMDNKYTNCTMVDLKKKKEGDEFSFTVGKRYFTCRTVSGSVHKFVLNDRVGLEEVAYNETSSILLIHREPGPIFHTRQGLVMDVNGVVVDIRHIESQEEDKDSLEYEGVIIKFIKKSFFARGYQWGVVK